MLFVLREWGYKMQAALWPLVQGVQGKVDAREDIERKPQRIHYTRPDERSELGSNLTPGQCLHDQSNPRPVAGSEGMSVDM